MTHTLQKRPVVLCVLDGWGYREDSTENAIAIGRTPSYDRMMAECPHALLDTSGPDVGLPEGQMGNSEVGHMNLGAGRTVFQELQRITNAASDGTLATNQAVTGLIDALKASGGTCHLMGLISPGGVHSHQDHVAALARIVSGAGIPVTVHAFLDGRDTPPQSAKGYLEKFAADIAGLSNVTIGTVSGRYYAMDRDKRWDRVEIAWRALMEAKGETATAPVAAVEQSYAAGTTDEFVLPTVIGPYAGMADGDGVMMVNFRADRVREILSALLDPDFDGFERPRTVRFAAAVAMSEYSDRLAELMAVIFPPERPKRIMGEIVADAGLKQLRIAETEKYPHVTFFFNGGVETPFEGEERVLIPSPKVATYDLKPEMSAPEVTDRLVEAIASGKFDFILVNYANADMVGHTGVLEAAVAAIETLDTCLGRLRAAVEKASGELLITADHGNAELMRDPETGEPQTAHTLFVVPLILVNGPADVTGLHSGRLADVAPTLLALMGIEQPPEMTGHSLLEGGRPQDQNRRETLTA